MRVLRALFSCVAVGLRGRIFGPVGRFYEFERACLCLVGYADGVRPYIGYERDVVAAHVHTFVEMLRNQHSFGRGHTVFIGSVLLERRGGERRGGVLFGYAALYLGDGKARGAHLALGLLRLLLAYALAALFELAHRLEGGILALFVLQERGEVPILVGHERLDFALSVNNQAQGDRLHPARREAVLNSVV